MCRRASNKSISTSTYQFVATVLDYISLAHAAAFQIQMPDQRQVPSRQLSGMPSSNALYVDFASS